MNKQTRASTHSFIQKEKETSVINSSVQKHEEFYISVSNSADLTIPKSQFRKPNNSSKIQIFPMTMAASKKG
jgi:hypothetical protein